MAEVYDDRVNRASSTHFLRQRLVDPSDIGNQADKKVLGSKKPSFITSLVAGAVCGVVVDVTLYPLDTLKTRLQSKHGLKGSGGFAGIYKGIIPVFLGSAPTSAVFFTTYNAMVNTMTNILGAQRSPWTPLIYVTAAAMGETISGCLRVPIDIVKQRKQTSSQTTVNIIRHIRQTEGIQGFYRGFLATLSRDIPFSMIQFPLWEYFMNQLILRQDGQKLTALQTAYCGAASGAIAAFGTTPFDVIKTRIMLEEKEKLEKYKANVTYTLGKEIYKERGLYGLFAGCIPRVLWTTLGGFIYFGAYEKTKLLCQNYCYVFGLGSRSSRDVQPPHPLSQQLADENRLKGSKYLYEEPEVTSVDMR